MGKFQDLTGQKFNRLTVIERDYSKAYTKWFCKCDCGNVTSVSPWSLKSSEIKSCGCYNRSSCCKVGNTNPRTDSQKLAASNRNKRNKIELIDTLIQRNQAIVSLYCNGVSSKHLAEQFNLAATTIQRIVQKAGVSLRPSAFQKISIIGQKFNFLTVIDFATNRRQKTTWMCECVCGRSVILETSKLKSGHTKSCGCYKLTEKSLLKRCLVQRNRSPEWRKQRSYQMKGSWTAEKNPNWKGGLRQTLAKSIRALPEYKNWRTSVYLRDNRVCQHCNQFNINLNAHHIYEFRGIIKDESIKKITDILDTSRLWDITNGLTLCFDCHMNLHKFKNSGTLS